MANPEHATMKNNPSVISVVGAQQVINENGHEKPVSDRYYEVEWWRRGESNCRSKNKT